MYLFLLIFHGNGQQQRIGMQEQVSGNPAVIIFSVKRVLSKERQTHLYFSQQNLSQVYICKTVKNYDWQIFVTCSAWAQFLYVIRLYHFQLILEELYNQKL